MENEASLGANAPIYSFPILLMFRINCLPSLVFADIFNNSFRIEKEDTFYAKLKLLYYRGLFQIEFSMMIIW
jgi:hypothetical protein